jgi:rSAM/selenodomain-associated transferase 2
VEALRPAPEAQLYGDRSIWVIIRVMGQPRTVSVIVPVYNEEEHINVAIPALYAVCGGDEVEVIIVDGNPKGNTLAAAEDRRITRALSDKGRARQMNRGASLASCDVFLFLHADTQLPPGAFSLISEALDDPRVVGGAFDLGIDAEGFAYRLIERLASLRSRLTRIPYGDQAIFLRRDYFHAIGGYREIALMEDVELMRRIRRSGDEIRILPHPVLTSARRWREEGMLYCTIRNWSIFTLYMLGVSPEKLARFYR